ncbi:unnamed protein product [Rhizophagus irregularis]|nr:unnamed protein product [Rhizophagus irregularis]
MSDDNCKEDDDTKSSYKRIRIITSSPKNRYNTPPTTYTSNPNQVRPNTSRGNNQYRPQQSRSSRPYNNNPNYNPPNYGMNNWDEPYRPLTNHPSPNNNNKSISNQTPKSQQNTYSTLEIEELHKKIAQQDLIIKDLCGQIKGFGINQKQHAEDIKLLQTQERINSKNMETLDQQIKLINLTITEQQPHINQIPEIHSMLLDIRN